MRTVEMSFWGMLGLHTWIAFVATDIHVRPLPSAHSTKHPIQRSGN